MQICNMMVADLVEESVERVWCRLATIKWMTILAKEAVEGCLRRKEEEGEHLKDLPFSLILDSQQGRGEA